MKILDWYILKKILVTFFFIVALLTAILVVVDVTEKIEDFNNMSISTWQIITGWYLNFIPYLISLLSPILVFITAIFVTARLSTHTEIVAMISSGMSFRRVLIPYFMGSILIALLIFYLKNYVIPDGNKKLVDFELKYIKKEKFHFSERNVHLKIAPNLYVYLGRYDTRNNTAYKFGLNEINLDKLDQKNTPLLRKLDATRAVWDTTSNKWKIIDYKIRDLRGNKEKITQGKEMDTVLNLKPKDFQNTYKLHEKLTLTELNEYVEEMKKRGADNIEVFIVEKYERFAYPFAIIILSIIGAISAGRKSREGIGFQIAFGFVLAFIYILMITISKSFGQKGGLSPLLAVWIPNIVFTIVGFIMYKRIPK